MQFPSWSLRVLGVSLALAAGGLCLGLAVFGVLALQTGLNPSLRCYWLEPPLTRTETTILAGRSIDCFLDHCRAVANTGLERGLACYFPRPFPYPQLQPPGSSAPP